MSYSLFKTDKINNRNILHIYKVGIFYETYNEDAYILNYLTKYNIVKTSNYDRVGFPLSRINGIKRLLISNGISFIINDCNDFVKSENGNSYLDILKLCFDNINKNCLINMIIIKLNLMDEDYLKQLYFNDWYQ